MHTTLSNIGIIKLVIDCCSVNTEHAAMAPGEGNFVHPQQPTVSSVDISNLISISKNGV